MSIIAQDVVGDLTITTARLPEPKKMGPLTILFETRVVKTKKGTQKMACHTSLEDANEGHATIVAQAKGERV